MNGDPQLGNGDKKYAVVRTSEANYWFNIANPDGARLFTRPAPGTIVTERVRNMIYDPGFQNHNLGLFKDFTITERHRITFRVEAFNWLNHPDWGGPDTNPNNVVLLPKNLPTDPDKVDLQRSTFGKISSKNGNRELQFALRYQF